MKPRKKDGKKAIVVKSANKNIDFKKIKNMGVDAVVFKVPCSMKWDKKNVLKHCNEAKAHGILIGISVEVNCGKSVNLQSIIVSNIINKVSPDIYPIIELNKNNGAIKKAFSDKCLKLLRRVKENLGKECIIKSEINFANKNLDIRLRNTMFWVVDKEKETPSNSTVWSDWTCFSYSGEFIIDGIEDKFEICEIKDMIIMNQGCDCGCGGHHTLETKPSEKPDAKCESMKGFIQGPIVADLQRQLNIQFNAGLEVNGCFTEKTLDNCILIMRNARGPITKIVQTRLEANGFSVGPTGIDGIYGDYTIAAVKRFQKKYNLKVTGVVNKATWRELFLKR